MLLRQSVGSQRTRNTFGFSQNMEMEKYLMEETVSDLGVDGGLEKCSDT